MKTNGFGRSKSRKLLRYGFWCLKTYENCRFWKVEAHPAQVMYALGLANLCWHQVVWLQGGSKGSKSVLVQVWWHQGQQICAGAYKRQSTFFGDRNNVLDPRAASKWYQSSVLLSFHCYIGHCNCCIWTLTLADRTSDWWHRKFDPRSLVTQTGRRIYANQGFAKT